MEKDTRFCPECSSYLRYHPPGDISYRYKRCGSCGYTVKLEKKNMIALRELNPKSFETTPEIDANLAILLERINKVRDKWATPMTVTSGLRDLQDHLRIYEEKNKKLKDQGKPQLHVPMNSKHLYGQACDISDPEEKLKNWVNSNIDFIEEVGLWMEDFNSCPGWVHFQCTPPLSGKRFFIP